MNNNIHKVLQLVYTIFLCLCACENNKPIPKSFDKVFEGKIDKSYILLKMSSDSGVITGSYFYTRTGGELRVQGSINFNDSLTLNEYEYNKPGKVTGTFKGRLWDNHTRFLGKWEGKDTIYNFDLLASGLIYEKELDTIRKSLLVSKEKPVNLTGFEGTTTLTSRVKDLIEGGNTTCFSVDYSKYIKIIKAVHMYITIDDKNIKKLNEEIKESLEKVGDLTDKISIADKRVFILHKILENINKDEFFEEDDGSNSKINIYMGCLGSEIMWKETKDKRISFYTSFEGKTPPWFSTQIQRENLPENGFDICFENPVSLTSVKFDIKVVGLINTGSKTKLVDLSEKCNE